MKNGNIGTLSFHVVSLSNYFILLMFGISMIGIEKKKRNGFVEITMIVSPIIPYQGIPDAFTLPTFSGSTFDWILEGHLYTPEELGLFKEENKK